MTDPIYSINEVLDYLDTHTRPVSPTALLASSPASTGAKAWVSIS